MSLYEHGPAIFYQRSKAVQDEFELIRIATLRDQALARLADIIREVKEERKELDDDVILETFRRINQVREITIQFIKYLNYWQGAFTQPVRPMLFEGDYLLHDFMKSTDFVNSSKIRKIFNFQFYRGNVLLLPFPNMKTIEPPKVRPELHKELELFANANEDEVVACYQVLINTLPDSTYREKLVSLEKWLIEPWTPNVTVSDRPNEKFFTKNTATEPEDNINNNRRNSKATMRSGSNANSRRGSVLSSASRGKGNPKVLAAPPPPPPVTYSPPGRLRKGGSQKLTKALLSDEKKVGNAKVPASTVEEVAAVIPEVPELKVFEPKLTAEQKQELAELDQYYEDLENQFLPKINKRAQSADASVLPKESKDEDVVFRGKKIFYSTTKVNTSDDNLDLVLPIAMKLSSPNKKSKKKGVDKGPEGTGESGKEEVTNATDGEVAETADEEEQEVSDLENDEDEEEDGEEEECDETKDNDISKSDNKKIKKSIGRSDSRRMSEITMNVSEPNSRRPSVIGGTVKSVGTKGGTRDLNTKKLTLPSIDSKHKKKGNQPLPHAPKVKTGAAATEDEELSLEIDTSSVDDYNTQASPYRRVKRKPKKLSISTQNMRAWYVIQQQTMTPPPGSAGHY